MLYPTNSQEVGMGMGGMGGLPGGTPAGLFATHMQKLRPRSYYRWHVDRRDGGHWIELGHFESKRLARIGMAEAIARGEPKDELRLRRRWRLLGQME
jgi:hypothetical protein